MTPAISKWLGRWPVPFSLQMAQTRFAEALDAIARGNALIHVIEHQNQFAGWIGGGRISGTDRGAFGFWLGEAHQGQALMQEAAPAFVITVQARLALHGIEAACRPGNYRSAKVLAACGLRHKGSRVELVPARSQNELVHLWECTWIAPHSVA